MGAAREMYLDEKLAQQLHALLPSLMIQIWYNHSHDTHNMQEEILESIDNARRTLNQLEEEVKKGTQ